MSKQFLSISTFTFLLALSFNSFANEDIEEIRTMTIDFSQYTLSELEVKKSVLRVLIANNWKILEHKRNLIKSAYKNAHLETTISQQTLRLKEIPTNAIFSQGWLDKFKAYFLKDIEYYHRVNEAKKLMN